ncbi:MAG: hypothetical protein ACTSU6_05135, partial [Candidatus Njordarchaeales archaeon]
LSERMDITRLNISRPTIQKYLKILEKYNLICRKYSEQKKTKKEIKVTTLGVIFFLIITSDTLKKLKKALEDISQKYFIEENATREALKYLSVRNEALYNTLMILTENANNLETILNSLKDRISENPLYNALNFSLLEILQESDLEFLDRVIFLPRVQALIMLTMLYERMNKCENLIERDTILDDLNILSDILDKAKKIAEEELKSQINLLRNQLNLLNIHYNKIRNKIDYIRNHI